MPQRGLYPVQGAAARREGDRRNQGDERAGLSFAAPTIDLDALRCWKDGVVNRLTGGLTGLAKQRKVTTVVGTGTFTSPNMLSVAAPDGTTSTVSFDSAIIAAGSEPVALPFLPHDDPRVIDSTGALDLTDIPERLLVLGGGIIGLEMATVYAELGTRISVVELMDQLIPGADKDLVTPLTKRITKTYDEIWLGTKVTAVQAGPDGLTVSFDAGGKAPETAVFDKVLVAVGRRPTVGWSGRTPPGCSSTSAGSSRSTNNNAPTSGTSSPSATSSASPCSPTRPPTRARSPPRTAPGTTPTSTPPSSRRGLHRPRGRLGRGHRERSQSRRGQIRQRRVPLGRVRPLTVTRPRRRHDQGPVRRDHRPRSSAPASSDPAGDLIAEAALAIETGADAADIGLTIHPHPTLSETVAMAAEAFEGTITDLYMPKKKK